MLCVDKEKCNGDAVCSMLCPAGAIQMGDDGKACIDGNLCMECFACKTSCSQEAIYED
jgi:MinD superfamily P-loop ATPase